MIRFLDCFVYPHGFVVNMVFKQNFTTETQRAQRKEKIAVEAKNSDLDNAIITEVIELALLVTNGRSNRGP
jgi:hypothetical protein